MKNDSKKTILLVDDHDVNIDYLHHVLDDHYLTLVAASGAQALELASRQPDLILLDIMMPDMDGYEVCRRLKSSPETSNIPIIFVTGKDDPEDEVKGLTLGAVDYFIKPMHGAITLARIKNHLELKVLRDELQGVKRNLKQFAGSADAKGLEK